MVHRNIFGQKLDLSSTQEQPVILHSVIQTKKQLTLQFLKYGNGKAKWVEFIFPCLRPVGPGRNSANSGDKAFEDWLSDDVNSYQRLVFLF